MTEKDIKPIPNYIMDEIFKRDIKIHPWQESMVRYYARLCVVQQPLHFGAVERRSRYAVVYVFAIDLETVLFRIFSQHRPLVVYRYRFSLTFVLLGKSVIQSRHVILLFHMLTPQSYWFDLLQAVPSFSQSPFRL